MVYVGVDGCKKGWFTVGLGGETGWEVNRFDEIRELWERYKNAKLILIDIPIGLRDNGSYERRCDKEARKLLGHKRGSSVFPVPCRAAVYAGTYEAANRINKELTDRGLSRQAWGIIPKIRHVDQLFLTDATAKSSIREIHPEVCFWALNSREPMMHPKKSPEGYSERLRVLHKLFLYTDAVSESALQTYKRSQVARDDIIDALAAAVTASREKQGLSTIPEKPEADSRGLPMQMVYCTA
jgi:predicted RNase H-like nuclease